MNLSSANGTLTSGIPLAWFSIAVTNNVIVTILCLSINYINGTLVYTFRKHQIFNTNPRYILFIHLVINDIIQLVLSTFLYILSYFVRTIYLPICLILLVTSILATLNTPLNLAAMAVECYIAICIPLRHGQICTIRKTYILIGLIWVMSFASILPDVIILLATQPLQFLYSGVTCRRNQVFNSDYSRKKRDISHIIFLVLVWLILIHSYFRILFAAKEATGEMKKARITILLHGFQLLLCMLTYVRPMFLSLLLSFFPTQQQAIYFSCYVIINIMPRFLSPIVYGLRDQIFRQHVKRYLLCKVSIRIKNLS